MSGAHSGADDAARRARTAAAAMASTRKRQGAAFDEAQSVTRVHLAGWPANVQLYTTTRLTGGSQSPYAAFNLAAHVGDSQAAVDANRKRLGEQLPPGTRVAWLSQVHGTRVTLADRAVQQTFAADACWTSSPLLACAVMTADCLPILITDRGGSLVAAVHAGWRGLAGGVVENTLAALPASGSSLMAWLGPAIGPLAFEVGPEVRDAFMQADDNPQTDGCFSPSRHRAGYFLADLRALAQLRLTRLGVSSVFNDNACTFSDPRRFYSHRRDGVTGRMASVIVRTPA